MTRHEPDENRGPETRLTDYLFGELDARETRALEAELAADADLRVRLEELRATCALLKETAPAAAPALSSERRAALRAEAATPPGRVLRFPLWLRAAAAVAVVTGIAVVWRGTSRGALESGVLAELGHVASAPGSEPARARGGAYMGPKDALSPEAAPLAEDFLRLEESHGYYFGGVAAAPPAEEKSRRADPDPAADAFVGFLAGEPVTATPPGTPAAGAAGGGEARKKDADRGLYFWESSDEAGAMARLESLGYADGNADIAPDPAFDKENSESTGRFGLDDGYGRRHEGRRVLEHLRRHGHESPRDMFFRYYGDNAAVRAADDPLSTFAADVDTASWALARNYLVQGHLPPKAAVRTEECVNAFRQELAPPAEGDFAIQIEAAPTPFAPEGHLLLRVGLKAREVARAERKPLNLVFVVDKSGSMAQENRIELVKQSLELLVDQIRDDDTIGIVAFDSDGHEILAPTAGAERWKIREALRRLSTGGSTNAAEGLFLGYAMAERAFRKEAVNRVVLASDGVANTGETDQAKILAKVRQSAEADVDLTTIGVGMGNHNDVFLERLADDGDGSCHYVDSFAEAKRVFVERFTGTMQVVAREARVQVEFAPGAVREWRQLGYENRALRDEDFRNDAVDAGEIGAGHEMVALYEVRLADLVDGPDALATVRLRWKPDGAREFVEIERTIGLGDARSRWDLASPRFRLAGTVAQYAEFLRRSVHARGDSYDDLRQRAAALARELREDPMVAEFRDLVDRTAALVRHLWPEDELALLIEEARRLRLAECELESLPRRSEEAERLLQEVRLQNEALERRLEDLLQPR